MMRISIMIGRAQKLQRAGLGVLLAAVAFVWAWQSISRAEDDRVSLNVADENWRSVVRSLERQSGAHIVLPAGAMAREITLKVKDTPLPQVLAMIASRTDCELIRVEALHRAKDSIELLLAALESGENAPPWTGIQARLSQHPGSYPPGHVPPISYSAVSMNAGQVAQELTRIGPALFVLEDGLAKSMSLSIRSASPEQAGDAFAHSLAARRATIYLFRPFFRHSERPPLPPPGLTARDLPDDLRKAFEAGQPVQIRFDPKSAPPVPLPGDELLALPPPDPERAQQTLRQKKLDAIRNSTPKQRLERLRQTAPQP